jgi:hypothetical protein
VVGYLDELPPEAEFLPSGTHGDGVKLGHSQTETLRAENGAVLRVLGLKAA